MAQQNENLDYSGLFKLDVVVHLDVVTHSFYEIGLKKLLALSSDKELVFIYLDSLGERCDHSHDWDFLDNPIYSMCFEPSGTWLLIVSDQKILIVPFLPLFDSKNRYDMQWSLNSVSVLPFENAIYPTSVVWWLTKESVNVLIVGSKNGSIIFYALDAQTVVAETRVPGEITELQICYDDSMDLLTLLISGDKSQHWKLIIEDTSIGYNWVVQSKTQADNKREGFLSYIKQFSKDKLFSQGSKDDKSSVEYMLKPVEYLPVFRKGSNNWSLTVQYVNGRHFLTAFELNEGTLILESPDEDTPSRTLRPRIKNDEKYIQGLWSQRLIYLIRKNELEIHSSNFSVIQGEALLGTKREFTELWRMEVMGDILRAYLMTTKEPAPPDEVWEEPTFLCDLKLPRFNLEPCLIITTKGVFTFTTVTDPCEWIVGMIMRGGAGAELTAASLGAPVPVLLRAAADMLLSRGKIAPAHYLYSLSQSPPDGWVARLGVFGRVHELSMYRHTDTTTPLGNTAITINILALLLKVASNSEENFDIEVTKFINLTVKEFTELAGISAAIGLWDLLPVFSIHRGHPKLMFLAIKTRSRICRGTLYAMMRVKCLVPLLIEENAQWLFHFITENIDSFDLTVLKHLCLWLNPLQEQLRPIMRDLKQGITTVHTTRLLNLITTFIHVASEVEARDPCPEIHLELTPKPETWRSQFVPRRSLSCGLAHWALVDDGNAKVMMTETPIDTEIIGRVIDVACGRHHTLVLTENGVYAAGDNSYGQLGLGTYWPGGCGDAATAAGALMYAPFDWEAPVETVAAGHYHSAAIDKGGRLYTWGWNVHGQLGLGTIEDHSTPQLVTKFQGRKVLSVGCGACHTVVLMRNGEVWACGAGVFGQLGSGHRDKSSVPVRVVLPHPVDKIAVGYFHNLALSSKGELWSWGSSPQQTRAAHARQAASPAAAPPAAAPPAAASPAAAAPPAAASLPPDPHLAPRRVDTSLVRGSIKQISAAWHHSCLINNAGTLYTWGLNFDGQLGSKDRKPIQVPTEVKFFPGTQPAAGPEPPRDGAGARALVACGGDFTVYVDDDGRIYASGNMHLPATSEKEKGTNRVIMMKTTKRVLKIPAHRTNNQFLYQHLDRIDIMFPFDVEGHERKPIEPRQNPLTCLEDFDNKTWADDVIIILKHWINEENLKENSNMAAKFAYHSKSYANCLKFLLNNLQSRSYDEKHFHVHSIPCLGVDRDTLCASMKDELKIIITNVMSQRIKKIALTILTEQPYPTIEESFYEKLPCCCNEFDYFSSANENLKPTVNISDKDLAIKAANLVDKCISIFPVETDLWELCFGQAKDFFVKNNLPMADLETVLRKYMESNAMTMAAAIMYSKDCAEYSQLLTPKFYLNLCSYVMDTWG